MNPDELNRISGTVVDAAMTVHTELGPGLLYKSVRLDAAYQIDLLVENEIVVELKTISAILPIHESQLLTYLKLSRRRLGLIVNFQTAHLRDGIRRMVNNL